MMSNTPLKINQSYDYIVGMGILWFILRVESTFLGWLRLRALKRVCRRVSSRPIVAIWGKSVLKRVYHEKKA